MEEIKVHAKHSKAERYEQLIPQLKALLMGEKNVVANLSNISAALKQSMNFFWVGFYLVEGAELVLGPFQGPVACTRIQFGKGVCGTAAESKKSIIVPNVDEFPGHIACSAESKSEIVLPLLNSNNELILVLDIDSNELNSFDQSDEAYLTELLEVLKLHLNW
jgi:L-methionine (R)-S-oxide reductase